MNILWIPATCPFPVDSGGKYVVYNRIKYLSDANNIYLIAKCNNINSECTQIADELCSDYSLIPLQKKSKLKYLLYFLIGKSVNVEKHKSTLVTNTIKEYLDKYKIDLINIDVPMAYAPFEKIRNVIRNIPIIINQHNIEFSCVKSKAYTKGVNVFIKLYAIIESRRLKKWEEKLYKKNNIEAQVFLTNEDKNLFQKTFGYFEKQKYYFCPPAVDLSIENINSEGIAKKLSNKKNIVFSASFDYPPNIHGAMWFAEKVFPIICKKIRDIRLILVGRNPDEKIKSLESEYIMVTGSVESVVPYCLAADVIINPIFFGGGVKIKLIQAGVYNKPLVSSSFGAYGSAYKNIQDILISDEPFEFAQLCIDAIINPSKYSEMIESFRKTTIDNYSYESTGKKYEHFIKESINN